VSKKPIPSQVDADESDFLWGARNIGAFINKGPRETYHGLENGWIPAKKVGDLWVSTKSALRAMADPES
jgi:hypothetical protein